MYTSVIDERMFEPFIRKRIISRFVVAVWMASEVCEAFGCTALLLVSSSFFDNSFSFSIICESKR